MRALYYKSDEEQKKIPYVKNIEDNGMFYRVTYSPLFSDKNKTTNIRKDKVIRYDE